VSKPKFFNDDFHLKNIRTLFFAPAVSVKLIKSALNCGQHEKAKLPRYYVEQ
jgi:hypothetical protein